MTPSQFLPVYAANRAAEGEGRPGRKAARTPSGPSKGTTADLLALATMPRA